MKLMIFSMQNLYQLKNEKDRQYVKKRIKGKCRFIECMKVKNTRRMRKLWREGEKIKNDFKHI